MHACFGDVRNNRQSKPDSTILLMTASVVHQARAMLDLLTRYNWRAYAVVTGSQTVTDHLAGSLMTTSIAAGSECMVTSPGPRPPTATTSSTRCATSPKRTTARTGQFARRHARRALHEAGLVECDKGRIPRHRHRFARHACILTSDTCDFLARMSVSVSWNVALTDDDLRSIGVGDGGRAVVAKVF